MFIRISRVMLILLVILVTSIYLPYFYWISLNERIRAPYVQYSPVVEKFVIRDYEKEKFYDIDGNEYTREETDELLPLTNYRLLATKGLLPDTIQGIKINIEDIRLNSIYFRLKPIDINMPQIKLYPLFESKPERLQLEMPDEFFRITDRMEFLTTETNEIENEMTSSFSNLFIDNGFKFPAKNCYGNPTTRKAYDEGYFVIDNNDKLYHIKKIKGKPFCEKVNIPDSIKIKTIFLREYSLKEFYTFVITEDDGLYLILFDNYKFQQVPIRNYNSDKDVLRFQGNLFYRLITVYKENQINVYVTDRNYKLVDEYQENWKGMKERTAGLVSTYLFPFELEVNSSDSMFINFYFSNLNYSSIYLNIILVFTTFFLIRKRKSSLLSKIFDYVIVLLTGIFGFLGVIIFRAEE